MAQAAKHIITEHDLSAFIPTMAGMRAAIVVNSNKGDNITPRLISNVDKYISQYGIPNPANGTSEYAAINYLTYGGPLWVIRATHSTDGGRLSGLDPKYSCALVRTKVSPLPTSDQIPDPNFVSDQVVKPIAGMTKHEIDTYVFELYKRNREYGFIDTKLEAPVLNADEMQVFGFEDLKVGQEISLTPVVYVAERAEKDSSVIKLKDVSWCNVGQYVQLLETKYKVVEVDSDANTIKLEFPVDMTLNPDFPVYIIPYDMSANYEITELEDRVVYYDKLTLDKAMTIPKGSEVRFVKIDEVAATTSSGDPITVSSKVNKRLVTVSDLHGFTTGMTISINGSEMVVVNVRTNTNQLVVELVKGNDFTANNGDAITIMKRSYIKLEEPPFTIRTIKGSNQLIVTESDYIKNGALLTCSSASVTNHHEEFRVESKDIYKESQKWVHTNNPFVCENTDYRIYRMDKSEFEERDGFLVYSVNPGVYWDDVNIEITPSKLPNAFYVRVYYKGVYTGEEFHVSRQMMLDGFNNQLEIEYVINGNSNYIGVKNNVGNIDDDGNAPAALQNNYSVWRRLPDDVFQTLEHKSTAYKVVTAEDVVLKDVEIMVDDNSKFNLGDRIKFSGYPQEYKIKETRVDVAGNKVIILDRKINFNKNGEAMIDPSTNEEITKIPSGTEVLRFHHVKYYPVQKLDTVYPGKKIPMTLSVAGDLGTLLDAGINSLTGGHNGSTVTTGDWMMAVEKLFTDRYKFQLVMDGGVTQVPYQQKIVTLAEKRMTCFAYLSNELRGEKSANPLDAVIKYRNKTNLNTSWASIFSTHLKCYDQYNQMEVVCSPDAFAAAAQAHVARNSKPYNIAAGWTNGKIKALGVIKEWDMAEMDELVSNQVNPIRYADGKGISVWGNETMQTMPSYLSMRHVRMLLIVIEQGLIDSMEYQTFQPNDESSRGRIVYMINKFLNESVSDGYYELAVLDKTTDSNINNREGVFQIIFSPKTSLEVIKTQLVVTSKGMDFSLVSI